MCCEPSPCFQVLLTAAVGVCSHLAVSLIREETLRLRESVGESWRQKVKNPQMQSSFTARGVWGRRFQLLLDGLTSISFKVLWQDCSSLPKWCGLTSQRPNWVQLLLVKNQSTNTTLVAVRSTWLWNQRVSACSLDLGQVLRLKDVSQNLYFQVNYFKVHHRYCMLLLN